VKDIALFTFWAEHYQDSAGKSVLRGLLNRKTFALRHQQESNKVDNIT